MALSKEDKEAVIAYRVEKSYRTWHEANRNAEMGFWSLAANRLYYSAFYMVMAVNLHDGETTRTHNGAYSRFSQKYVATGILTKEEGHLYRNLFAMRQSGDYDDLFDWDESDIVPLLEPVKSLIVKIHSLIE